MQPDPELPHPLPPLSDNDPHERELIERQQREGEARRRYKEMVKRYGTADYESDERIL